MLLKQPLDFNVDDMFRSTRLCDSYEDHLKALLKVGKIIENVEPPKII